MREVTTPFPFLMNCNKIKTKLNEAKMKETFFILIRKEDVRDSWIEEMKDCGFNVTSITIKNIPHYKIDSNV